MDAETLSALLEQLASPNNASRNAAETHLNTLTAQSPGQVLCALASLLGAQTTNIQRAFAAVLLRRIAVKASLDNIVHSYQETTHITSMFASALINETVADVRWKISDCAAQIAQIVSWPELPQVVSALVSSQDHNQRRSAFLIISGVPELMDATALLPFFSHGASDSNVDVRLACLKAATQFLAVTGPLPDKSHQTLIPLLLNILPPIMSDPSHEDGAVEAIGHFISLGETHPKIFSSVLPTLVAFMCAQMKNDSLEDGTRQICLEMLLTLTECAPGMMRRCPSFGENVIPICLDWMAEIEDEKCWYESLNMDDDDNESNETAGEQAMDRLAIYLGAKIVLPVAFSLIPTLVSSVDWQKRHSGLRCISAIGEGCHSLVEKELERVIAIVLPHLQDPHPRVRHAACNAIGQMCTDFSPKIQTNFHAEILAALIPVMDDMQSLRVKSYAAAAMVNFAENASKDCIAPYLETIIPKLLVLMDTGVTYAQEQAITTLATVADSAGPEFSKFYSSIMPTLLNFLHNSKHKELRSLRGKTLECSSLVALAVGKDIFATNAVEYINILHETQAGIVDSDDPQASYLLSAWARVCKILGADFAPYLETVLPPLIKSAQLKPDVVSFDPDAEVGDEYSAEEGWEMVHMNGKKIGIKTSILDEKCTAVEMLVCYAEEMGALFHPFVESIMKMLLPMLKFYFHDGVRYAACTVIPLLLKSWSKAQYPRESILSLWHFTANKILDAMDGETDIALVAQFYTTFTECLEVVGKENNIPGYMSMFTIETLKHLQSYFERTAERAESRNAEDYEPEDEDALQDDEDSDESFLDCLAACIHEIFKMYGVEFLPFFDQLLPAIDMFMNNPDASLRQWALCIFDDLIEFTGEKSATYLSHFISQLAAGLADQSPDIRQAAAYGVGIAALNAPQTFASLCNESIPHLFAMINAPDSRSENNITATENSISAIAKICSSYKSNPSFPLLSIVNPWIATLPVTTDDTEAISVYTFLIDLIDSHTIQPDMKLLVAIITGALESLIVPETHELTARMVKTLGNVLASCDVETRGTLWVGLGADTQKFLARKGYV